eukprot:Skav229449  [mRNA]  locus=scaffold397:263175:266008:- [translate_table: standard]
MPTGEYPLGQSSSQVLEVGCRYLWSLHSVHIVAESHLLQDRAQATHWPFSAKKPAGQEVTHLIEFGSWLKSKDSPFLQALHFVALIHSAHDEGQSTHLSVVRFLYLPLSQLLTHPASVS